MVEITWTVEQALQAQTEFEKAGGKIRGPLAQWQTLHDLEELRNSFESGDKKALLHAVFLCTMDDLVIPEWAAAAFRRAYRKVAHMDVGSWDEAFGPAFPKNSKVGLMKRRWELRWKVRNLITKLRNEERLSVGPDLFARVAKELRIGKRQAKDYFYEMGGLPANLTRK